MIKIKKWNQHLEENLMETSLVTQKICLEVFDEIFAVD